MDSNYGIGGEVLSLDELSVFSDSLDRVLKNDEFLDHFYKHFIQSSPEVARVFNGVNMDRLKSKLATTLNLTAQVNIDPKGVSRHLKTVGGYHQKLSIPPSMYYQWTESLITSLKGCDKEFTEDVEKVWRKAINVTVSRMHDGYSKQ